MWNRYEFTLQMTKVEKVKYLLLQNATITARGGVMGREKRRRTNHAKRGKSSYIFL
jgi:hypothetical protein